MLINVILVGIEKKTIMKHTSINCVSILIE